MAKKRNIWDNIKHNTSTLPEGMGIPEGLESEQVIKNLSEEIMTKKFPDLVKEKGTQIQEAHRVPNKWDPKRPTPRYLIIKVARLKDKERILKAKREE